MNLLAFAEWCEATPLSQFIRESVWMFPAIEAVHLVTFALIGGAILVVDLRLLGLVLRRQSVAQIASDAQPWLSLGIAVMILSGVVLFVSEAVKCYYSDPFWIKMSALSLAILFTFTVRKRVVGTDEVRLGPVWGKVAAASSLSLWAAVAWGGRWIGFS